MKFNIEQFDKSIIEINQITFKTIMAMSYFCDYCHAYKIDEGTITILAGAADIKNKKLVFKNCAPFTEYISKISIAQVDCAKDLNIVMALHYSLEFSNSDSKISRSLLQYYKGQPSLDNNENVVDFDVDNITDPLKLK